MNEECRQLLLAILNLLGESPVGVRRIELSMGINEAPIIKVERIVTPPGKDNEATP